MDKPIKTKTLKQLVAAWVRYRKSGGEYVTLDEDISRYWREQLGDLYDQFYLDVDLGVGINIGWIKLYVDACKNIKTVLDANPTLRLKIGQVKQKLGGLRMYVNMWSVPTPDDPTGLRPIGTPAEVIGAIISAAVEEADRTCETCGEPGAAVAGRGIGIKCSKHARI